MARLEIDPYDGPFEEYKGRLQVKITLSRRNLLALLHKLEMEDSARRIENGDCYIEGELADSLALVFCSEEDEEHYRHRRAGVMLPDTEAFIIGSEG